MSINKISLTSQNANQVGKGTSTSTSKADTASTSKTNTFSMQSGMINQLYKGNGTYGLFDDVEEAATADGETKTATQYFENVKDRMTENDAEDIEDEGMTLEKYESERLDRALERIKTNRQEQRDSVDKTVDKQKQKKDDIEKTSVYLQTSGAQASQVQQALENANLPVTEANIEKVTQAADMAAQSADGLSDQATRYMISNELEPTIANLYQAGFSSSAYTGSNNINNQATYAAVNVAYDVSGMSQQANVSENDWNAVKDQVAAILEDSGMDVTDESVEECKWLFEQDLPITKETIGQLTTLNDIQENFNQDEVLEQIIKNYETGTEPEDTSLAFLSNESKAQSADVQAFLQQVEEKLYSDDLEINDISLRRQLEEIRLKMTTEVSSQLAEKGIKIDIENLSEIVDGLKEIEQNYYKSMLQEDGTVVGNAEADLLKETVEKVNSLRDMPNVLLGKTFATRDVETINSLYDAGEEATAEFTKAEESYESLMTEVRRDLGDSIKKAFAGIGDILKDLGLEQSQANIRAVRILGYNNIEINEDSIAEMKNYDSKVQSLIQDLKPQVAVEMIKQGINPLDTPIDQVNEEIQELSEDMGVTDTGKYSEFLWKLDQKKELSEEERGAYVGLYRLIHQVEKSDGAAIGSVVKSGQDLTLQNLYSAVKTAKSGGVDVSVDDEFGSLESVSYKKETISEQIDYYRRQASSIMNELSPESLSTLSNEFDIIPKTEGELGEGVKDMSLEMFQENLQSAETEETDRSEYLQYKMEEMYQQMENSEECISYLEGAGEPATFENIMSANQLLNNNIWKDVVKQTEDKEHFMEKADELVEQMDSETFAEDYEEFVKSSEETINESIYSESNTIKDVSVLRLMGSSLQLTGSLSRNKSFNMPIVTGDQVTNVNVTLEHKEGSQGKVTISYESATLGKVQSEWIMTDSGIKGFITSDSKETVSEFRNQASVLEEALAENDVEVKKLDFGLSQNIRQRMSNEEESGEEVDTNTLMKVAKIFIKDIQTMEMKKESV